MQNTNILILDVHDKDKFIILLNAQYRGTFIFVNFQILHDAKYDNSSLFYFMPKTEFLVFGI